MDIFEDLREIIGCMYISDMRRTPYRHRALCSVTFLDLDLYPIEQLSDLSEYLTGRKRTFENHNQAQEYFALESK